MEFLCNRCGSTRFVGQDSASWIGRFFCYSDILSGADPADTARTSRFGAYFKSFVPGTGQNRTSLSLTIKMVSNGRHRRNSSQDAHQQSRAGVGTLDVANCRLSSGTYPQRGLVGIAALRCSCGLPALRLLSRREYVSALGDARRGWNLGGASGSAYVTV